MSFTYKIVNTIPKGETKIITKIIYNYDGIIRERDIEHDIPTDVQTVTDKIITEGVNYLLTLQNLKNQSDVIGLLNQITDEQDI
ncbi:hypothetical protein EBZ38_11480 [bacterium]|jgi:hypothetical protein|nr:hypothetical protein [bacterium]